MPIKTWWSRPVPADFQRLCLLSYFSNRCRVWVSLSSEIRRVYVRSLTLSAARAHALEEGEVASESEARELRARLEDYVKRGLRNS